MNTWITEMAKAENASDVLYGLAKCSGKLAPFVRDCIVAKDWESIVDAWTRLDVDGDKNGLAKLRTNLNREAKKIYGHGLTVKAGKVVAAAKRNRTESSTEARLVELARQIETNGEQEVKDRLLNIMEAIVAGFDKPAIEATPASDAAAA